MAEAYAFLELEGIEGESQDSDYTNQIEVLAWNWGVTSSTSFNRGTGAGVSRGELQDISISKNTDKASLNLAQFCTTGKHIGSGKLTLLKLSGEEKIAYFTIELTEIVVASWHAAGSGGDQLPMEQVSLSYVKVDASYKPQGNTGDPAGNVDFSWNVQTSKG